MARTPALILLTLAVAFACTPGRSRGVPDDSEEPTIDGGLEGLDAGDVPDAAAVGEDAGGSDAGEAAIDAGAEVDAGEVVRDAGPAGEDAGPAPIDAGTPALGAIGDPCGSGDDCEGGSCFSESAGSHHGSCTRVCDDGVCPAGAHCSVAFRDGHHYCLQDCLRAGDCRADGFACWDADADGAFECYAAGTGSRSVGSACAGVWECAGGTAALCITNWPGGYCSIYCAIAACPGSATCEVLGGIGYCLENCHGPDDCQDPATYWCLNRPGSGRPSTCQPR